MALPTITVNSSTGSDTAASGSGGTAVTAGGNNAAATSSNTSVDLSADAPSLAGVATDGSMALWVGTSSGRQWSKITAVDDGTKIVTVESAYGVTESGKNWGIGGKRAGLALSLQLFKDVLAGWIVDIEDAGSSYVLTTPILANVAASTAMIKVTSSSGTRPTITSATSNCVLVDVSTSTNWIWENLKLTHTAATRADGFTGVSAASSDIVIRNCIVNGCKNGLEFDNITNYLCARLSVSGCEILNSTVDGVECSNNSVITDCYIHDNASNGIRVNSTTANINFGVFGCVFETNGAAGLKVHTANMPLCISHCTFTANVTSGIITGTSNNYLMMVRNCIFYANGTYGIEMGSQAIANWDMDYNAYGANGTAARLTFTAGAHDVTLTASPFVSATDYGLNTTAGGGAACHNTAAPVLTATANPAGDIGGVPSGGGGVAGGIIRNPGMGGGCNA